MGSDTRRKARDVSAELDIETVREHTGLSMTIEEAREALVRDAEANACLEDSSRFFGDTAHNPLGGM